MMTSRAFIQAAKDGNLSKIQEITSSEDHCFEKDDYGDLALNCAAQNGHESVVAYLLDENAEVDAQDAGGYTALHRAAYGGHKSVIQCLIQAGADRRKLSGYAAKTALQMVAEDSELAVLLYGVQLIVTVECHMIAGGNSVAVTCTALSGKEIASMHASPSDSLAHVQKIVADEQGTSVKLITSSGEMLEGSTALKDIATVSKTPL